VPEQHSNAEALPAIGVPNLAVFETNEESPSSSPSTKSIVCR
jgi:hypothetical protein